jgi:signal transduction histidine kinase
LNAVLGFSEILQSTDLDEEQEEFAEKIHQSGERLLTLLERILFFAAVEAGRALPKQSTFSVGELTENLHSFAKTLTDPKGLALDFHAPDDTGDLFAGDVEWIGTALQQIVDNACKFTAEGTVTLAFDIRSFLSSRGQNGPGADERSQSKSTHSLVVDIQDTGEGIPTERQTELFALFKQADGSLSRRFEGVGLGLIMAKKMLEPIDGTLRFASSPGEGSQFHIEIPLRMEQKAA